MSKIQWEVSNGQMTRKPQRDILKDRNHVITTYYPFPCSFASSYPIDAPCMNVMKTNFTPCDIVPRASLEFSFNASSMGRKMRAPSITCSTPWFIYSQKKEFLSFLLGPKGQRSLPGWFSVFWFPRGDRIRGFLKIVIALPNYRLTHIIGQEVSGPYTDESSSPSQLLPLCVFSQELAPFWS